MQEDAGALCLHRALARPLASSTRMLGLVLLDTTVTTVEKEHPNLASGAFESRWTSTAGTRIESFTRGSSRSTVLSNPTPCARDHWAPVL